MINEDKKNQIIKTLVDAAVERIKQEDKWGEQDHVIEWMSILGEEYGELCKEFNDFHWGGAADSNLREEAIQVAAVALAIAECCDRNGWIK